LTIFIKRPYRQATLMAKSSPQQSTRFKLRNQGLNLGQTTSSVGVRLNAWLRFLRPKLQE
jgi:hypothetical protein